MGVRHAEALLVRVLARRARVVLFGGVLWLGSFEARGSFGQFQGTGLATFKPKKIVRRSNHQSREAPEPVPAGNAKAFAALPPGAAPS